MRLQAQKLNEFISHSTYELRHKFYIKVVDEFLLGADAIYNKLWRPQLKTPKTFLRSARSAYRKNETNYAIDTLEAGLREYPDTEDLLALYLRICSEQEQFARVIDFINSANKQLHKILAGIRIAESNPHHRLVDAHQKHGLAWLTEKIINKDFDDVVALWRLADLLEYAGEAGTVNRVYQRLSKRPTNNPEDYLYAGLSEMRLGNAGEGFRKFELGLRAHPESECLRAVFKQCCYIRFDFNRYLQLKSILDNEEESKSFSTLNFYRNAFKHIPPEAFILKFKDIELKCSTDDRHLLEEDFLAHLREYRLTIENAKLSIFFTKFLDHNVDFSEKIFQLLHSLNWGSNDKTEKYLLALTHKLTLPIAPHHTSELEEIVRQFAIEARALAERPMDMTEPISDLGKHWYPWQSLFCLAQPRLYRHAMSAFETLAFKLWPRLDYIAPHVRHLASQEISNRKIRIGFTVLDSMPMMSGFMGLLNKDIFETVFLRPGPSGESRTAGDWIARASTTVEYSDSDAYSAIDTIANQELDILISGPSAPQIFFPVMARLAHLQMVLLEPNWPDGITNSDYYISWQMAEPENYKDFYKTRVSLLQKPPYWIERSSLGETSAISDETCDNIRQRLLGLGPNKRFYLCANTTPKVHPVMDEMLYRLLKNDPESYLVFLRGEHAISQALKARLQQKFGRYYERIIFLDTLPRDDAHCLLLSADCCIDSYPLCGMSSSFDGLMLGAPIVTLPTDIPFGRWTAAIYEYIGVSDLTARDVDEYISIAMRLANDKDWRLKKSAEIREKALLYVESKASFDEFQHFLIEAWRRKQTGLPPENWVAGKWQ